jgi:hypothetical protein
MNPTNDIVNGYVLGKANSYKRKVKKYSLTRHSPHLIRQNGQDWSTDDTWTNYPVWDVPNSLESMATRIDWNIVKQIIK